MENCNDKEVCSSRRGFLVKAAMIAGGVVLTISNAGNVFANDSEEITVMIDEKSKLNAIGGSEKVKTQSGDKILVVRTGETEFKAVSAKCTHKGGPLSYNKEAKNFSCSWHDSVFGMDGNPVSGPAKTAIAVYAAETKEKSVIVKVS